MFNFPMKPQILLLLFLGSMGNSFGQSNELDLFQCYEIARNNYPKIKEQELIRQSSEYSVDNVGKRYLPQIHLNGQATYQSDVTSLPIALPGVSIDPLNKDQYKLYGEVVQPLTDLFIVKKQKEFTRLSGQTEQQKLEVELYGIRERISQLYFGILLIDAQLEQTEIIRKDLNATLESLQTAESNGVTFSSKVDQLNIEALKLDQRVIELQTSRKAFIEMLGLFLNQPIDENTQLKTPFFENANNGNKRPELQLFEAQKTLLDQQSELVNIQNFPHLNFFFQGGYGRPALNFLSNNFDPYFITGFRLSWNISGYYTQKKEKQIIELNRQRVDVQKETFELGVDVSLEQKNEEIEKYKALIEKDEAMIVLHDRIMKPSKVQLENGEITSTEYITRMNGYDQAILGKSLHEIQLLIAQSERNITQGN